MKFITMPGFLFPFLAWVCLSFIALRNGLVIKPISLECARQNCNNEFSPNERNVDNLNSFSTLSSPVAFHMDSLVGNISDIVSGDVIMFPKEISLPAVWELPSDLLDDVTAPLFVINNEQSNGGLLSEMPSQFLKPTLVETLNLSTALTSGRKFFHSAPFSEITAAIPVRLFSYSR